MTTDRNVHQVRVQFSILDDGTTECCGFGVDVRPLPDEAWHPVFSTAFARPMGVLDAMIEASGIVEVATKELPLPLFP